MDIKLSPTAGVSTSLVVFKQGDILAINGLTFDLSELEDGGILPVDAINSPWFAEPIERADGRLKVTLTFPTRDDATEEERFPAELLEVPDGRLVLPGPQTEEVFPVMGFASIDWSLVITRDMKYRWEATASVLQLRAKADAAIAPLQDAVDLDDATVDEMRRLTAWKRYRVALNRLPEQAGWPTEIDWPALPA